MSKLRVNCYSISFDGYSAGPDQTLENPLGVNALQVFNWQFATRAQHQMHGGADDLGGETGMDNDLVLRGFENVGAWILGRNMFGPVRGPWPDDSWKGWWGDNPPYHVPVFVLTHHAREPLAMEGGTTFHFVTDGIHSALAASRRSRQRKRCSPRRRRLHHPAISSRRPRRRDAPRLLPSPHRPRRKHLSRPRSPRPRLPTHPPHRLPQRHPHVPNPQNITPMQQCPYICYPEDEGAPSFALFAKGGIERIVIPSEGRRGDRSRGTCFLQILRGAKVPHSSPPLA